MGSDLELFITVFAVAMLYVWFSSRVRRAIWQMRQEELIREAIRRTEQQRKIDELYGRDKLR